jgi:hypothetical protein
MRIETRILDGRQVLTIKKFAQRMRERLSVADWNFDTRRRIIEELGVQIALTVEDDPKMVYATCLVSEAALSVVPTSFTILGSTTATSSWMTTSAEGSSEVG